MQQNLFEELASRLEDRAGEMWRESDVDVTRIQALEDVASIIREILEGNDE